jgi:hypothetical protein
MEVKDYLILENKNNSFIALATTLSFLKEEHISSLYELQIRIDTMIRSKVKDADPFLEFKIGLHKFLSLQILKLRSEGILSDSQTNLSYQAIQSLFHGECGWWYENYFLTHYAGLVNRVDTLKQLFCMLLLEVACTTENFENPLKCLYEREKEILILYRGMKEVKPISLDEIGEKLNLSRERVRQIKDKGIKRIILKAEKMGIRSPNYL